MRLSDSRLIRPGLLLAGGEPDAARAGVDHARHDESDAEAPADLAVLAQQPGDA